ncbi:MAG: hypothetical protein KC457_13040, partial [Myxococcales bacterium]|nr:hypothetical protein [Myxococcales bacterium]
RAYTAEGQVVFAEQRPSLHVAAHEAAHALQQQAGRVPGGLGARGDGFERHADAVADAVVSGRSAEGILDRMPSGSGGSRSSSASEGAAVQRYGESEAVLGSRDTGMRRGNRRGSIVSTGGESIIVKDLARKMTTLDTSYRYDDFTEVLKKAALEEVDGLEDKDFEAWRTANEFHIVRVVNEALLGANCGDFAFSTGSRLMASTTNQWVHYGAMKGYVGDQKLDHAFALTYPLRIADGDLGGGVDKRKAIVADTWADSLVTDLEEFMAGTNPYEVPVANNNIQIKRGFRAKGQQVFDTQFPQNLRSRIVSYAREQLQQEREGMGWGNEKSEAVSKSRTDESIFEFNVDGSLKVRMSDGTKLWPQINGVGSLTEQQAALTFWANHSSARFDWNDMAKTNQAIAGLIAAGNPARQKAFELMNALDNNKKRKTMMNALSPTQLWDWIDSTGIKSNSGMWARNNGKPTMSHVVDKLDTARLKLLKAHISDTNWSTYVNPHLSKKRRRAVG